MKRSSFFLLTTLLISLWSGLAVFAGTEPYENFIKGKIKRNDTLLVKDEKFRNAKYNWSDITNISVKNTISFRLTDQAYLKNDLTCTAYLKVEYLTSPDQQTPLVKNIELKISYSPKKGATYKITDSYAFDGAYWVRVTVDNIYSPEYGNNLPANFQLTNQVVIDRQYLFKPHAAIKPVAAMTSAAAGPGTTTPGKPTLKSRLFATTDRQLLSNSIGAAGSAPVNSGNQLQLTWALITGAEEYDIEWTTADQGNGNYALIGQMAGGTAGTVSPALLNKLFLHNATRITTHDQSYLLSLAYNDAYILVRMRQVQYTSDGIRLLGDWDYKRDDNQYAVWSLSWYQQNLNWQYSAAFAEDGKKKEVVSYFDGTLRGRQSVTINNSDNVAVVQENVYDEFGRATASILPAPFKESSGATPYLHYFAGYNLNSSGNPYNAANILGSGGACEVKPDPLDASHGASLYYSPQNPFKADKLYNYYIPDAEGYPLSVTQYTPDGTGRIKLQGGVGKTFQPGDSDPSKATKYYYGKPEQWELDRLFGNDVGLASHYLKNMVVDPNGQISISYVNASGKTIATALTGSAPAAMDALSSAVPEERKAMKLLDPSKFIFNSSDLKISATTTYLASVSGPAALAYNIEKLIDQYPGGAHAICSNCYYDLSIKVVNDCNTSIYATTTPIQLGAKIADCDNHGIQADSLNVNFPAIGEYYVTFELAFSKTVMENYVDRFVIQGQLNGALKKEFDLILPKLNALDLKGCLNDCKNNLEILGSKADFTRIFTNKLLALDVDPASLSGSTYQQWIGLKYDTLKNYCEELQQTCYSTPQVSPCDQFEKPMREDVSPGGQYALFDANGSPLETASNVISNNWRTEFPVKASSDPLYVNEQVTLPDGSVTSPYDASFTLPLLVQYWKDDWAAKFLKYHPEYCKLLFCWANSTYELWDQQVQEAINKDNSIAAIPGAAAGLHYDHDHADWLVAADPFFQTGAPGAALAADFRNDLQNYSHNVLKANGATVKGLAQYIDYILYCSDPSASTNSQAEPNSGNWDNCSPENACRVPDREWATYKQFYFQLKQSYYNKVRSATTCANQCQVGTPLVISPGSACPSANDLALNTYSAADGTPTVSCDAGHQTMTLSYLQGKLSTAVTVTVGYADGSNTSVFQMAAGDSTKNFCIPNNVPAQAYTILSVVCPSCQANPLLFTAWKNDHIVQKIYNSANQVISTTQLTPSTSSYFDGTLSINNANNFNVVSSLHNYSGAWSMDSNCQFSLTGNNVTYYLYNVTGQALSLGHREGNIEEIWYFDPAGPATNCTDPATLEVASIQESNAYLTGAYPARHLLSVIPGTVGSPPAFSCSSSASPGSTFYTCLNIHTSANTTISYQNVWVFNCVYDQVPATCPPMFLTKESRFYDTSPQFVTGGGGSAATQQAQLAVSIQSTNNAAADGWIEALRPGITNISLIPTLKAKLIEVANLGGDIGHPFGASTTPPGTATASGYTSFGDAIKGVLGISSFTSQLNPWLIGSPYPYSSPLQQGSLPISKSSPAICTLFQQFQAQCNSYNTAHGTSLSLFAYLSQVYGGAMSLSANDLQVLQNSCGQCRFILASDIDLPVFLQPNTKACILPSEFSTAKQYLQTQFGGSFPDTDPNYEQVFATFMNQRWGFDMSYPQYAHYDSLVNVNAAGILCNQPALIAEDTLACITSMASIAVAHGKSEYAAYIAQQKDIFRASYISTCSAAKANVNLYAPQKIYHYTLYYYDQADNLVRTIPPEGVHTLSDEEIAKVVAARNNDPVACAYTGPATDSDKPAAFTALSNTLSGPSCAIEMWLYNDGSLINHLVQVTPDHNYLVQASIDGNYLGVDIYPASSGDISSVTFSGISKHYRADISALLPLKPFTHIVLQGNNLGTADAVQLFMNGTALTVATVNTSLAPGFTITGNADGAVLPDDVQTLKHLRLYSQPLSTTVIAANAASPCFSPTDVTYMTGWYRFNTPVAGGPTTISDNSTVETQKIFTYPSHGLATNYLYNSTNQVSSQQSPDGGTNRFWYDLLSRLVISQNDKQLAGHDYSYTNFDLLGRITEVGQKKQTSLNINAPDYLADATISSFYAAGNNSQITHTYYDAAAPASNGIQNVTQNNLRKRVAASTYRETAATDVQQATYYDYDLDGNVKTLYQQIAGLALKRIDYEYDLVSGKVNFVSYQKGQADQFYYRYHYDADNRITEAWSSPLANLQASGTGSMLDWTAKRMDASYQYYLHGPLARMELGDVNGKVQGLDYAYTLQGWLKGVNTQDINAGNDIGQDGSTIARDAYGYSLGYYNGDYKPIGGSTYTAFGHQYQQATGDITGQSLYNGNISNSTIAISPINSGAPVGYTYHYDQLNRIKTLRQHTGISTWNSANIAPGYQENFTFDGNGNILTVNRAGATASVTDNLSYRYNRDASNQLVDNKLNYLNGHGAALNFGTDQSANNYVYDPIGNLTDDHQSGLSNVKWTVYGKIQELTNSTGTIKYTYDPAGQRASKNTNGITTWYVRDAQGNTLAVYDDKVNQVNWREQHLYGSSRLGMWTPNLKLTNNNAPAVWDTIGHKIYELTNHLGNVLATITEKRIAHSPDEGATIDYYLPDITTAQDYYAFGALMPNRTFTQGKNYRYGFNGKENDNEVKGDGNQQDYGMRIYDPRVGKWLSVDPLAGSYSDMSPYSAMGNNPMFFTDPAGGFLMDVHKRILKKVFDKTSYYNKEGAEKRDIVAYRFGALGMNALYSGGIVAPDVRSLRWYEGGGGKESVDKEHFDNMNFNQIVENYNSLNKKVDNALVQYKTRKISAQVLGEKVGEYFHGLQDLYSHSNYIELYEQKFGQTDVSLIPTFQEAMTQEKYKSFAELLRKELKTGRYPGSGKGSHRQMNHDLGEGSDWDFLPEVKHKKVNWNTKAAEAVAEKATKAVNDKVEKQVN